MNSMSLLVDIIRMTILVEHQPAQLLSVLRDSPEDETFYSLCPPRSAGQPHHPDQKEALLSGIQGEPEPPQSQTNCCDLKLSFPCRLFNVLKRPKIVQDSQTGTICARADSPKVLQNESTGFF